MSLSKDIKTAISGKLSLPMMRERLALFRDRAERLEEENAKLKAANISLMGELRKIQAELGTRDKPAG